jgi:hypothetical protein
MRVSHDTATNELGWTPAIPPTATASAARAPNPPGATHEQRVWCPMFVKRRGVCRCGRQPLGAAAVE